jgi:hydrogenase maturation protein HypF
VYRLATELGLAGWVLNSAQGVFIEVDGPDSTLQEFLLRLERDRPPIAYVQSIESSFLDPAGFIGFEIRESLDGEKTVLILPDLATCPDCLGEVNDPCDRRYRYPFTNCTNCGPRFTIIESLPYDRAHTTMKKFVMCAECRQEYHEPTNRRFHAQPNACSICGPHLELWDATGKVLASRGEALLAAAEAVRRGQIVAVKGLGGFHLVVDARDEDAVLRLRQHKQREEKPFALMYPCYELVLEHCELSQVEQRLLRSVESPIVLLRRRNPGNDGLASSIAPRNPYLGVMLPYTPLHHLLMADLGFPIVATSGNLAEEPICTDEQEALRRLGGIAELFLVHNRPIRRHVDDSIVREIAARELVLRRARGFAPLPVQLPREVPSVLAVGAHQKNAIASSVGRQVFISQHIGDLETTQAHEAFQHVIATFRGLYDLRPEAVACDMHPGYVSTQFAQAMQEPKIAVQHHLAHVLACMVENDIQPPVLGVAWDGTGYGADGTVWGGEFLRVNKSSWARVAHLRSFMLLGGEKAVREPRRVALALLYEIFGMAAFSLTDLAALRAFSPNELRVIRLMLERRVNAPTTSSVGRLFDGVASLIGLRQRCSYEGQAAMELEYALGTEPGDDSYPFDVREKDGRLVLDWEPMVREIVLDPSPKIVPRKFHNTLARIVAAVARRVGEPKVVLSGGCFQNKYLTECAVRHISEAGFRPYWHQRVPPNDGGIGLGQIVFASSQLWQE